MSNEEWTTTSGYVWAAKDLPQHSHDDAKTAKEKLDMFGHECDFDDSLDNKVMNDINAFEHNQGGLIHRDRLLELYWLSRALGKPEVYMVTPPDKAGDTSMPFYIKIGDTKLLMAPYCDSEYEQYHIEV